MAKSDRRRVTLLSFFDALFIFGLVIFLYIVALSFFQPYWLSRQVFHFQQEIGWLSWLRNDTMGVIASAVSFLGFLASQYLRNQGKIGK
jgi:hypothetical protein